ncbi:PhzF family phenazine biosynthesis protein [Halalkalibacter urbisdiaboli]|uniref:PhzF family phenazine biosynthesis protein n=1 Tax=Halalkalibacter urbisdiaboli TaxID=1960589 RepID=UPI000B4474D7|nr:PhzF family phenazine biosynthesis isomerase [Halalkalibacter urbisdiaboli]
MRNIKVYHVDAFSKEAFGGNPAGVVPDATMLTEGEMKQIARELNLSETAFLLPTKNDQADYRIRFFTPTTEIDFCGHATLATAWLLATENQQNQHSSNAALTFETNIGNVPLEFIIENNKLHSVKMTQVEPKTKSVDLRLEQVASLVGLAVEEINTSYPVRIAYTGNWHLVVPVKTRKAIDSAIPNLLELAKHNKREGIVTTHLFTFDSQEDDCLVYTRDFAPAVGVEEDPVTGSANGALAGYFMLENVLEMENRQFKIAQGHACGRPGYCNVTIEIENAQPVIKVGGSAVVTISGTLSLRATAQ